MSLPVNIEIISRVLMPCRAVGKSAAIANTTVDILLLRYRFEMVRINA
jgi:hypothetical protein